jgi:hypothetical protein
MKRRVLAIVGAVAAILLVSSSASVAQTPGGDSAVGEGVAGPGCEIPENCTPYVSFDFTARSGPSGEDPAGTTINHIGGGSAPTFSGDVTCLSVTGNTAVVGAFGMFDSPDYFAGPVADWYLVVDGGGPGSLRDRISIEDVFDSPPPTDCSRPPVFRAPAYTVAGGDIVVHDAPPLPTSKEQCKNGGWRNFPSFKNEGLCVAFVQRGVKPAP